jgi:long-chain acyl-CoA synthetase
MKNKTAVLTKSGPRDQKSRKCLHAVDSPWLRSYPPGIDPSPDFSEKPLYSLLDESAANYADRPCVEFRGRSFSYAEIKTLSDRAAKGLQGSGFKPGMKLGLFLPNCPLFVVFYFAGLKAGGVIVNYNPLYVADEVARQTVDSDTEFMVTLDLKVLLGKFSTMFERTSLKKIIVCSLSDQLPAITGLLFRMLKRREVAAVPQDSRYLRVQTLLKNDGVFLPSPIKPKSDIAVLQYTGGTTGIPRGAALTHYNLYANALQCKIWFYVADSPESKTVGILPLFHALAMTSVMNWSLAVGGSMLLEPRFEAQKLLSLIHRRKPTILIGVPTLYTALMNQPDFGDYDLSSLKFSISGGAPLPLQVQQEFKQRTGVSIWEGYGLSEASPACCLNPVHLPHRPGSVGVPIPGTACQVVSIEDHKTVMQANELGEICFCGPQIMQGYWQNPEATAEVIIDGWLHTGDVGYMDADGYVFITDRLKEMISTSGYKVYPRQVEDAIYQHPAVKECAVFGVDDAYRGQTIRAAVSLKNNMSLSPDELDAFLENKLSHIEKPRSYDFRTELPKTAVGKIQKKILIDEIKLKNKETSA